MRQRGIALVLVLWLLLLLAVIVANLRHEVRTERRLAATSLLRLDDRLIEDGAINRAILSLFHAGDPLRWRLDGTPLTITLLGHDIEVRIWSESGKIDLNTAPPALLTSLFQSQGLDGADADMIAGRIIDWRSPGPPVGPDPAAAPYLEAGRAYRPRHGPFRTVGELRLVLGMTDALQAALAPVVTVYSGAPNVDRQIAGDAVLQVLKDSGDSLAESQLSARQAGNAAGNDRAITAGEAVTISARILGPGSHIARRAVLRITQDQREPYWVLDWQ
jgi:general secretion pathway protein K